MSAATIDRALRQAREPGAGRKRLHAPPSAAIRRSVPVRTFDGWNNPPPGFIEADLVAHSGPTAKGSFVQTLTLTDIATGWTECAPLLVREQKLLAEVLSGDAPANAVPAARVRHRQRQCVHERDDPNLLRGSQGWCLRDAARTARTIRPGSSRRTGPWSGAQLATGVTRVSKRPQHWDGCIQRCGCL